MFQHQLEKTLEYRVAKNSDAHLFIGGPTGSGKTRLAKLIHDQSKRASGPFVTVNLGTLHNGTLESELFGHERGSYTGADSKRSGRIEQASGGTLFLDEIAELPLSAQSRLLEFTQSQTIVPVGSNREIKVNARIIAATHQDLEAKVLRGEFREDLYHRLKVIELSLPPLSERADEFDTIVHDLIDDLSKKHSAKIFGLSTAYADALESYSWPGNIRELRNVLEFSILACATGTLDLCDFSPAFSRKIFTNASQVRNFEMNLKDWGVSKIDLTLEYEKDLGAFEKAYLEVAFTRCGGNLTRTAQRLQMNKSTLYRRMRDYGISVAEAGA